MRSSRSASGALLSVIAITRAALRVALHYRRMSLPDLVARLRDTPRGRFSNPGLDLAILDRLLPVLPPFGAGRCLKRSLFLLDLWSRAGLAPSLHLGFRGSARDRAGHAWVRTSENRFETYRPPDVEEAFRI